MLSFGVLLVVALLGLAAVVLVIVLITNRGKRDREVSDDDSGDGW